MEIPSKNEQLKKQMKTAILQALDKKQTNEKYLIDQVDEYMKYFDILDKINEELICIDRWSQIQRK